MAADDDALSWDGDVRDPTHIDGAHAHPVADAESTPASTVEAEQQPAAGGSALLVVYGAIGAAYLLFTVGWVLAITRAGIILPNPFFDIMYKVGGWLAVCAPAAWFGLTLLLTRSMHGRRGVALRLAWLGVGLLLLAPWPFIVGGAG